MSGSSKGKLLPKSQRVSQDWQQGSREGQTPIFYLKVKLTRQVCGDEADPRSGLAGSVLGLVILGRAMVMRQGQSQGQAAELVSAGKTDPMARHRSGCS